MLSKISANATDAEHNVEVQKKNSHFWKPIKIRLPASLNQND